MSAGCRPMSATCSSLQPFSSRFLPLSRRPCHGFIRGSSSTKRARRGCVNGSTGLRGGGGAKCAGLSELQVVLPHVAIHGTWTLEGQVLDMPSLLVVRDASLSSLGKLGNAGVVSGWTQGLLPSLDITGCGGLYLGDGENIDCRVPSDTLHQRTIQ